MAAAFWRIDHAGDMFNLVRPLSPFEEIFCEIQHRFGLLLG
jgi:hypothetical protein